MADVLMLHKAVDAFDRHILGCREMLESMPVAIYTTDAEGRLTYYNEPCVELSGRRAVLGEEYWCVAWKLYDSDGTFVPHNECPMADVIRTGKPVPVVTGMMERPDGTRVHIRAFPTPLFDKGGVLIGAINMVVDMTEEKAQEDHVRLMAHEVNHRANNLMAVVQGIVNLTQADTVEDYRSALLGRMISLARTNSLMATARWRNIDLLDLVREEVMTFSENVRFSGQKFSIDTKTGQSFSMMIHELATNAVKHGALSVPEGMVDVSWTVSSDQFRFSWVEAGGPATSKPSEIGMGSKVLAATARYFRGSIGLDWRDTGLAFTLTCPLEAIAQAPRADPTPYADFPSI